MIYKKYIKRALDFTGSLILTPFVGAVCLACGPFIYAEDHGPVFYKAKRRGVGGKPFEMYKLRSMKVNAPDIRNADDSTFNSTTDPRVTKVGRILRKTSIDELPQIFNVLKGDMSFIGPRPVTVDKKYDDLDDVRKKGLTVRPGITGYSQAYYRNSISQDEKLKLDAKYAEDVSFILDTNIFFKTIETVVMHKNIYNKTNVSKEIAK